MMGPEGFPSAVQLHLSGKLTEAEAAYGSVLALCPDHADSLHNLGVIAMQRGTPEAAIPLFRSALERQPGNDQFLRSLAEALLAAGLPEEGWPLLEEGRRKGRSDPEFIGLSQRIGSALAIRYFHDGYGYLKRQEPELALGRFLAALDLAPDFPEALNNAGGVLVTLGRLEDAIECFRRLKHVCPDHPHAQANLLSVLNSLGLQRLESGDFEGSDRIFSEMLALGGEEGGHLDQEPSRRYRRYMAIEAALGRIIHASPGNFEAYLLLGNALVVGGRPDLAAAAFQKAFEAAPERSEALNNLGTALLALGRVSEAIETYQKALTLVPRDLEVHRNLMMAVLYSSDLSPEQRYAVHHRFEETLARPLYPACPSLHNSPDPRRRLRLGYVSSDFRTHPVGRNMMPVLRNHDRTRFELFLYGNIRAEDHVTDAFRALADHWRPTQGLSDAEVADQVRADAIDVLVILAGRFDDNRPLVAAYRPAPVQIAFHEPATTGLSVMDGLISDRGLSPPGLPERFAERVIRLPRYYLHAPLDDAPPPGPLPMTRRGGVTFGSFNNPAKLGDQTLDLWGRLLARLPEARLKLKYKHLFTLPAVADRVVAALQAHGVGPDRLILDGDDDDLWSHLALYDQIDIALDPFPFTGSTTTFEALWMGVPVVTLAGDSMVGRWSASMLEALGLGDLIADSPHSYLDICERLACDPARLIQWRETLRHQVASSSLCDAAGRTRQLERVYRALWRRWCKGAGGRVADARSRAAAMVGAGQLQAALDEFKACVGQWPDDGVLWNDMGVVLTMLGRLDESVQAFQMALTCPRGSESARRNLAAAHNLLGNQAVARSEPLAARDHYAQALAEQPDMVEALYNLARLDAELGRYENAIALYRKVLSLQSGHVNAAINLGSIHVSLNRWDEALRLLEPFQHEPLAQAVRGNAFLAKGQLDLAVDCYRQSLPHGREVPGVLGNLGSALQSLGRFDEAVACFRAELERHPENVGAHRSLLTAILYDARKSEKECFAEHRRFEAVHAIPVYPSHVDFHNDRTPGRRLRIGYLSSDLREHPVARNLLPIFECHDRSRIDLYFYAEVRSPDQMTERFQSIAREWRTTVGLDDRQVADMIRADGIDILVILAGRFDDNRPLVAAYRPAPVMVNYGDVATSGLMAMGAVLTDPVLTPCRGVEMFTERPVRLPHLYAHAAFTDSPDIQPPPMLSRGYSTFGSFSNPAKLGDETLALWADVLRRIPGSRLYLKYKALFATPSLADRVLGIMSKAGISQDRIILGGEMLDTASHLALYGDIDIALDTFPFNGSTTTFEALWMGVPVVTLLGSSMVSRWTAAMLAPLGLSRLVAGTPDAFVEICADLCRDPALLREWRTSLRGRVRASSLCDVGRRARQIERVYFALWRRWLAADDRGRRGLELLKQGSWEGALASLDFATERDRLHVPWRFGRAEALYHLGRVDEAVCALEEVLEVAPEHSLARRTLAAILSNRGVRLREGGDDDKARACYERAITLDPALVDGLYNLAILEADQGNFPTAESRYREVLTLEPLHDKAALNLGSLLSTLHRHDEAMALLQPLSDTHPDRPEIFLAKGNAHLGRAEFEAAIGCYRHALELDPEYEGASGNLGTALQTLGRFDEALACYRAELAIRPGNVGAHRNLLMAMLYDGRWSEAERFAEHLRFAEMHAVQPVSHADFQGSRDPRRRLRIGFLSSDLRDHPVARNLLPVLQAHDPDRMELVFYAEVRSPDEMTERFQVLASGWRSTLGATDARVAEWVRADGIDVLVVLAGRFDDNRPLVAAHRAAPVQVSWYDAATSGLAEMDALLTDRVMTPRTGSERFTERPIRLPTFYIHAPIIGAPEPGPPPLLSRGYPIFGSFSNPAKLGDETLVLWASVLRRLPQARLRLKYRNLFSSPSLAGRVLRIMDAQGIPAHRILLAGEIENTYSHLSLYGDIDIALDTLPFNGSTTTFEALWMGVPVVTLPGDTLMSRWTAAMLRPLGLSHLAAASAEDFVEICARLVADPQGLAELRASLRGRVAASALCDAKARARQVERVFRALWRRWCATGESR